MYSRIDLSGRRDPVLQSALRFFGDVNEKKLLDLGSGNGRASLFFASCGAQVISIDSSIIAVNNLKKFCADHNIKNITPLHLPAQEIASLGQADYIFGSMILHHIEPFSDFASDLRRSLQPDGKGFFEENSARSDILMWFRKNIVGKLWVPKRGDRDESPLDSGEISELKRHFHVEIEYPRLVFFGLISMYLLRGKCKHFFRRLDSYFYRFENIRKYSYRQCLYLS